MPTLFTFEIFAKVNDKFIPFNAIHIFDISLSRDHYTIPTLNLSLVAETPLTVQSDVHRRDGSRRNPFVHL